MIENSTLNIGKLHYKHDVAAVRVSGPELATAYSMSRSLQIRMHRPPLIVTFARACPIAEIVGLKIVSLWRRGSPQSNRLHCRCIHESARSTNEASNSEVLLCCFSCKAADARCETSGEDRRRRGVSANRFCWIRKSRTVHSK